MSERRPATFAVYDEGQGVFSLYLSPISPTRLLDGLVSVAQPGHVLALGDQPPPEGVVVFPAGGWTMEGERLGEVRGTGDVLLLGLRPNGDCVEQLPGSLLARPGDALPEDLGAVAALHIGDADHAVVLARDAWVLIHCLRMLLEDAAACALGGTLLPELDEAALVDLIEPLDEGWWRQVVVEESRRYRVLDLNTHDSERRGVLIDRARWVAPRRGGRWLANWSW